MSPIEKMINGMIDKISNEETWITIGEGIFKVMAILIVTSILIRIGKLAIRNIFKVRTPSRLRISERREATLLKLLENMLTYVVFFVAAIMILSVLTIDVKALLAGAGIVGLAVGFGAQSLVKDIITGFFIIFEDQFSVGDYIRIDQFEGTVEEIGLRTTKIKNWTGEVHILPNGSIMQVTNFSLNNSVAFVDVSIAYEGDIVKVEQVLQELFEKLPEKYEDMVKPPEILGIQNMAAADVMLRVVSETLPMRHFYIARQLRKEIKLCLDEHGIEIPFPRLVMYTRNEQDNPKLNAEG
ncbi:mechanosensitive ion channel family protein [Cytobacillus firmus]|uniref:Mechanosensitive ion channel family protein n=1 Tax=Cytobacillus firmus TaxID=1399 RepID=A0AA46Q104_CYTFI|nr:MULTISPECIES: mechanosensitive ion channel family protein [Bacillales]MBG9446256.1 mechanosensitive ion channel protein MscS [Cytobacillus firmus]MBG9451803.1 mechanosensitive ion channel protein MscS [Cytobacillus firmus]MBY6054505.1 mechanosensitive ion channel family protein [Cytobacillus firmus]MCC3648121.1 mechanosensitive ion channel family protein [Cytobacillus oceanisediminis]MCS0655186.1 mechanosensitive ion channel family protein [Cytobacillus firmus]